MKWIHALEMENFKIHISKRIEFGRHMNVIVGDSDNGKSIALKAIIKCLLNKPGKKAESFFPFTKRDDRGVVVKIRVYVKDDEDGKYSESDAKVYCIERVMSKTLNEYNVTFPDGTETTYSKFGVNVPPEVMAIHGMREVDMGYGKEHLNYMSQYDGFFLLGKRPEEVATALGRLARTDIIDTVASGLRSDIDSAVKAKNRKLKELAVVEDHIKEFDWIDGAEQDIEIIKSLLVKIEAYEKAYDNIKELAMPIKLKAESIAEKYTAISDATDYERAIRLSEDALHARQISKGIADIMVSLESDSDFMKQLKARINSAPDFEEAYKILESSENYVRSKSSIREMLDSINKASDILVEKSNVSDINIDFSKALALSSESEDRLREFNHIANISREIIGVSKEIAKTSAEVDKSEKALESAINALNEIRKGACPVCGGSLEDADISEHISEV